MDEELLAQLFSSGINGAEANDIGAFQNRIAANDYWKMAAAPVLGARFDNRTWSPGTTLGVSAGQAFLGAALNALGQRSEAAQLDKVASVLPQLYSNPNSVSVPEGVDPQAFGELKLSALTKRAGSTAMQNANLFKELFGTKIEGLKEKEKILGRQSAYGITGFQDPESPQYKLNQDSKATADTLRKELTGNKNISDFEEVKNRIQVLQKAALDTRTVSDLDYVYGVAKVLDPASVVRESEGKTVVDSTSIPASLLGTLNKALSAGTALGSPQRQALFDLVQRHYDVRKDKIGTLLDHYSDIATKRGVSPSDVLPFTKDSLEIGIAPNTKVAPDPVILKQEAAVLRSQGITDPKAIAAALRAKHG